MKINGFVTILTNLIHIQYDLLGLIHNRIPLLGILANKI